MDNGIASTQVYTGAWTDWSQNSSTLGYVLTLNAQSAAVLSNFTAIFISVFVAACSWSIIAYCLHQRFQRRGRYSSDVLQLQHRLVWRNNDSPLGSILDIVAIYWAWRTWPGVSLERRPQSKQLARRTLTALIFPLLVALGFLITGMFAGNIVLSGNRGSNVLLTQDDYESCGHPVYARHLSPRKWPRGDKVALFQEMATRENLAARAYTESCYPEASASSPAVSCSFYPIAQLPYATRLRKDFCPFGDPASPFNFSPCNTTLNVGSYQMWTDMLDSNSHFGINASPTDRIKLQRNVTCSPINAKTYKGRTSEKRFKSYRLGLSTAFRFYGHNVTFTTEPWYPQSLVDRAINILVSYESSPADHTIPRTRQFQPNSFEPISDFNITGTDRTLLFYKKPSICYSQKVLDPFYLATEKCPPVPFRHPVSYRNTDFVSIMACIDSYRMCNPGDARCTQATSLAGLHEAMQHLDFNIAQNVTAQRLYSVLENTNTYTNIFTDSQPPLQIPGSYNSFFTSAPGMPPDQWTIEMRLWFEYGLAKMQQRAIQYLSSSSSLRTLAPENFPTKDPEMLKEFKRQCSTQRVKHNGAYTTFSMFGFVLVLVVGSALILIGLGFHPAIHLWRRAHFKSSRSRSSLSREYTYDADSKYHLHYMAIADTVRQEPLKAVGGIPVFAGSPRVPDPTPNVKGTYTYQFRLKAKPEVEKSESLEQGDEETSKHTISATSSFSSFSDLTQPAKTYGHSGDRKLLTCPSS